MEKSSALKDKSVMGLQADSKIRRTIRIIENLCKNGKSPTPEIFNKVRGLLGDARMVFNKSHARTSPEKVIEMVMNLKTRAEGILKELGE
ncbi:MAG: hypothetical protein ACE5E9_12550 [Nitrospinaceae bacterium]